MSSVSVTAVAYPLMRLLGSVELRHARAKLRRWQHFDATEEERKLVLPDTSDYDARSVIGQAASRISEKSDGSFEMRL